MTKVGYEILFPKLHCQLIFLSRKEINSLNFHVMVDFKANSTKTSCVIFGYFPVLMVWWRKRTETSVCDFWLKRRAEYWLIFDRALKCLIPFSTSYLCETGFFAMLAIKNKYRSKLELEPDLRLKLTLIKPDIADLCKSMQAQCSH